jgi:hypothetical protein
MRGLCHIIIVGLTLSACTTTYSETLEQKLSGKSSDEKRVILAQECGKEIEAGLKPKDEANVRHFDRMREICQEMTGKPVPFDATISKK